MTVYIIIIYHMTIDLNTTSIKLDDFQLKKNKKNKHSKAQQNLPTLQR